MEFKEKIKQLRISSKLKQFELAEKLSVNQKQISAYEIGSSLPSTDTLIKIAEIFNVSLDYLVFDKKLSDVKANIKDRELLEQLEEVDKFDEEKKVIIKKFLSLMINEEKIKNMVS